jgi:GDP-L-fucose synthase
MNIFENKKVLITGGTGMVGMSLCKMLLKKNAEVTLVSLDDVKVELENTVFIKKDLRDFKNCLDVCKNKDFVFHLAGVKGSPEVALKKPASFFVPTILFNTNLLEAARQSDVSHILYTSTIGVYAPAEKFHEDSVWDTFPSKNDWYSGWAKRLGELQLEAYNQQYNYKNYSIIRPANIYGPYDNFDQNNAMVIPSLINRALSSKDELIVWGNGSQVRDFVFSDDVARAMILAVEKKINIPLNVGSGSGVTIKKLVESIVANIPNKKLKITWDTNKPSGDKIRIMNTERIKSYGFECKTNLSDGIKLTIDWYLKNVSYSDYKFNSFNN